MIVYIGLDLSLSSTGVCVLVPVATCKTRAVVYKPDRKKMIPTPSGKSKKLSTVQYIERLSYITSEVLQIVRDAMREWPEAQFCVVREDYSYSKNSKAMTGLAELVGSVLSTLYKRANIVVHPVGIKQSRKIALGRGLSDKTEVATFVESLYGERFDTTDECDAFVLAMSAYYMLERSTEPCLPGDTKALIKYRADSADKIFV